MVALTPSDARAYCLGVAQIIPVIMIALFVIDGTRFVQVAENTKKQAQKALDIVGTSFPEIQQEVGRAVNQSIEEIDNQISVIDRMDRRQASEETIQALDISRSELVESRARLMEQLEHINQTIQPWYGRAASIEGEKERLESAARKVTLTYAYGVILGIVLALAGEAIALWGAVGLISARVAVACITDITVVLVGSLARYAIERLMPIPSKYHAFNIVQYCWVSIILFAQFTFVWILINVHLHS